MMGGMSKKRKKDSNSDHIESKKKPKPKCPTVMYIIYNAISKSKADKF